MPCFFLEAGLMARNPRDQDRGSRAVVLMAGRHNRFSTATLELPRTGQDAEEDRSSRINQWQHACPGSLQGERASVPYQETTIHALEVGLDFLLPDVRQVPCKGETLRKTGQLRTFHGIGMTGQQDSSCRKAATGFWPPSPFFPWHGLWQYCTFFHEERSSEDIHLGRIACTAKVWRPM